jgi:hypothetical protein
MILTANLIYSLKESKEKKRKKKKLKTPPLKNLVINIFIVRGV